MQYSPNPLTEIANILDISVNSKTCADQIDKFIGINDLQKEILIHSNQMVLEYISVHLDLNKHSNQILFCTRENTFTDLLNFSNVCSIINFKQINDIVHINQHLRSINKLLPDGGIYIGRVETYINRKERIFRRFGNRYGQFFWLADFIINRVIPRTRLFEGIYRFITQNKIQPISKAEILGRLAYNGFEIIDYKIIDGLFYFIVIKLSEPSNEKKPSYYALIRLKRIGKGGRTIEVFKIRTMHPYSEYLHDYVIKLYEYNDYGKPADNFRISRWGKFLRKYWIDEIPQIINIIKGEMKLVGCRPVSYSRFKEFPLEIQQERIKYKPGIIPPYIALLMPDPIGNIKAEKIYFDNIKQNEFGTNIRYLLKSMKNILLNKIRGW